MATPSLAIAQQIYSAQYRGRRRQAVAAVKGSIRRFEAYDAQRGTEITELIVTLRHDLAGSALGDLWERFSQWFQDTEPEPERAWQHLEEMQLRFPSRWGQPEDVTNVSRYIPEEILAQLDLEDCLILHTLASAEDPDQTARQLARLLGCHRDNVELRKVNAITRAYELATELPE